MQILSHTLHSKEELLLTGIYKIYHEYNSEKIYIGSASRISTKRKYDSGFLVRWKKHLTELTNNCHANTNLQRVVNKYGLDNLRFEIVEKCDPDKCIEREDFWIEFYNSYYEGYNLRIKGNSQLGVPHTQITKDKIRDGNLNKVVSNYTKSLISESKLGKSPTEKTIQILKNSCPTKKKIYCYNKVGELYKIFESGVDCDKFFFPEKYKKGRLWGYLKNSGYLLRKYLIFQKEMSQEEILQIINTKKSKVDLRIKKVNIIRLSKKIPS